MVNRKNILTFPTESTTVLMLNSKGPRKKGENTVPEHTLSRIPRYHQILLDREHAGVEYVSSHYLSTFFGIDSTQVRKDLAIIGYQGKPKTGYSVTGLKQAIAQFLGINIENAAVLIGAGKLGSALIEYPGFHDYGLKIIGVFDNDPGKIGTIISNHPVLSMESLPRTVRSYDIGVAIVTVPKEYAQQVVDTVISLGIRGIWNFAPVQITVPKNIALRTENIAMGLAILSYYINKKEAGTAGSSSCA